MKKLCSFIATFLLVAGLAGVAGFTTAAWSQDQCNFSPAFQQVRSALGGASPLDAAKALQALASKPQSPDLCEAAAVDDALGAKANKGSGSI
jgi:hypothetical protein